MAQEVTVYQKMTSSTQMLMSVVRNEIGIKACAPFAVKALGALNGLGTKLTEEEAKKAANTFLDNLQTLTQGGITTEDYDKVDFVKRGKVICISARAEAFLRAAARKGYRITETIIAVPKEDAATTYFEENFYQGSIIYTLKDARKNGDRKITAQRLISKYFDRFICRLEICEIATGKRMLMTVSEISNEEVLAAANASDNGIYKSEWVKYKDSWGKEHNRKEITDEINTGSIWNVWTAEMVNKTVMRRALKRVKEILPELKEAIYAFDVDGSENNQTPDYVESEVKEVEAEILKSSNVDIMNLTEEQQSAVDEMLEIYKANPKLAADHANEIKELFESGKDVCQICNEFYASILNIAKSKDLNPIIKPFLNALGEKSNETD